MSAFELLLGAIERGVGSYLYRRKVALREMFNPINWIAYMLRLPIVILERAGIETANKVFTKNVRVVNSSDYHDYPTFHRHKTRYIYPMGQNSKTKVISTALS